MQGLIRTNLIFALAMMVAVAGIGHVQARHQAHGATTLVICTGYGLVRITIDSDGNPVDHTLPCPDCTAGQAALLPDPAVVSLPELCPRDSIALRASALEPGAAGIWHQSRAPPFPG